MGLILITGPVATLASRVPRANTTLMISRSTGLWARFAYVGHLQRGQHTERDDVLYLRGSEVSISGEDFWCSADGELYGPERQRTWHVERAAFSMTLP